MKLTNQKLFTKGWVLHAYCLAFQYYCIGKRVKWPVLTEVFKSLFIIFQNKSKSRSIHMKMSSLKPIYMEILRIETQTEITTFKTVMVTKENNKKSFFGTTYSGVVTDWNV